MFSKLKHWSGTGLLAVLVVSGFAFGGQRALASTYNSGLFGTCTYNCKDSTTTTLPSGLQVNINLSNGQTIPSSGYTILVTPLNGQGSSFQKVDFYLGGVLIHTQTPDEQGTVQWLWQPDSSGSANLRVVVTGQAGQAVDETFQLTVAASSTPTIAGSSSSPNTTKSPSNPSILNQVGAVPHKLIHGTEQIIRSLPTPIKHALPYFLFLILAADALLLFVQTRREVAQSGKLQALLARERQSSQLKRTFTSLISHYLRTPLTIIAGAVDVLKVEAGVTTPIMQALETDLQKLGTGIESLVARAATTYTAAPLASDQPTKPSPIWRKPSVLVPVVLVGIVAFWFDYLAQHAGAFSVNRISLVVQVVIFASAAVMIYQLVRGLQLHRRRTAEEQRVLDDEATFGRTRDGFIESAAQTLTNDVTTLDTHILQLAPSPTAQLVRTGQQRLHDVMAKLQIARSLKGATTDQPPTSVSLHELLAQAVHNVQAKATTKGVRVTPEHDVRFAVRSPELLVTVIQSIIDNAIEYSPAGGHVVVDANLDKRQLQLSVTDQGPGIPQDKQFALFQAFSKLEGAEVFNHEGMGFSLYLDKLIMHYLVGDIAVESTPPHGTTVILTLSTSQSPPPA